MGNHRCYHVRSAAMNLPNSLTVSRIFLVPLLVVVLLTKFEGRVIFGVPKELVGAIIFAIASLTDWADGYLARRRKQITPLGQVIDPLADKLLISAALMSLVQMDLAPAWMVCGHPGARVRRADAAQSCVLARRRDSGVAAREDQDGGAGRRDTRADPRARPNVGLHGTARWTPMFLLGQAALWVVVADGARVGRQLLPPLRRHLHAARRRFHRCARAAQRPQGRSSVRHSPARDRCNRPR